MERCCLDMRILKSFSDGSNLRTTGLKISLDGSCLRKPGLSFIHSHSFSHAAPFPPLFLHGARGPGGELDPKHLPHEGAPGLKRSSNLFQSIASHKLVCLWGSHSNADYDSAGLGEGGPGILNQLPGDTDAVHLRTTLQTLSSFKILTKD